MSDYSTMQIKDLEELKERLLSQRSNLDNTIDEVIQSIKTKRLQLNEKSLSLNPYYKDRAAYLKVTINNNSSFRYNVVKISPAGKYPSITQFDLDNINFLKYYKMCSKSEWDNAIDRFNIWLKDSNLKVEEL